MAHQQEQTLADVVIEQRNIIARDIGQVAEWLKSQSAADVKDHSLNDEQRALARRVFNRVMHIVPEANQASDAELDAYFLEAKLLREVVPVQIASVQAHIDEAARTVTTIFIYANLANDAAPAENQTIGFDRNVAVHAAGF